MRHVSSHTSLQATGVRTQGRGWFFETKGPDSRSWSLRPTGFAGVFTLNSATGLDATNQVKPLICVINCFYWSIKHRVLMKNQPILWTSKTRFGDPGSKEVLGRRDGGGIRDFGSRDYDTHFQNVAVVFLCQEDFRTQTQLFILACLS